MKRLFAPLVFLALASFACARAVPAAGALPWLTSAIMLRSRPSPEGLAPSVPAWRAAANLTVVTSEDIVSLAKGQTP